MARSLWTGSLSFGLVNVPVQLFSAVRDLDVHFTQIHEPDGARIDVKRFCAEEEREVPYEEILRGYEVKKGKWVTVTDEELEAVEPRKTKTIDIEEFVDLADVDPIYFDHPYFLVPADNEGAARAYRLLVDVMERSEKVALGRFVMRTKEYLVAIRARDGALSLTTMLFHDEVRPANDVPGPGKAKKDAPAKREVDQALEVIEAMSRPFDPSRYDDCHRERLLKIIARKRKGETIKAPSRPDEPSVVPDLMAALEQSLQRAHGDGDGAGDGDGLDSLSREELYERAKAADVPGRSNMSKDELVDALSD